MSTCLASLAKEYHIKLSYFSNLCF